MRVLVYRYGLLAPTENADVVREQMRAAHDYRNTLVEIERGRRAARRAAEAAAPEVSSEEEAIKAADKVVEDALKAVKQHRSKGRTRQVPEELKAALTDARIARRDVVARLREARKAARENKDLKARVEEIEEIAKELRKNARAYTPTYWGTYLLVEEADQAARKAPLYDGAEPNDPAFQHWSGEGLIGVQLQKGAEAAEIFDILSPTEPFVNGRAAMKVVSRSNDTRLRVEHVPHASGKEKQKKRFGKLWMRVGSTEDRKPVWAVFPMIVHRELPPGARIKRAIVQLRKIGPREEWSVLFTLELPDASRGKKGGVVAVDLGWRALDGGAIRVGTWQDDQGGSGEIVLDARAVSGLRYPEHLRSIRDKAFDAAREEFVKALKEHRERASEGAAATLPDWLLAATETVSQWRSAARLAALAKRWRSLRFEGDAGLYEPLERWRYHDHHLWQWENDQRSGSLRNRREIYRVAASQFEKRYDTLVLEGTEDGKAMNLAEMREKPSAEKAETGERSQATLAAPGELRRVLLNAFQGSIVDGEAKTKRVVFIPAKNTTKTCHACGSIETWNAARDVHHTCSKCGTFWDQDVNAAKNLLLRHLTAGQPAIVDAPPPEAEATRWKRVRAMKNEKDARKAEKVIEVEGSAEA